MNILINILWVLLAISLYRYIKKLDNNKITWKHVILVFIAIFVCFRASLPVLYGITYFTF